MQKNKKTYKDFDFTELSKPKIPKNLNITQKIRQAEIPFDESQQDALSDRGSFKSQFSKLSHNQNQANDTQGKIKSLDQTLQFTSKNVIQQRINKSQNSTQHTQFYTSRNSSMSLASDENYFVQDDYETITVAAFTQLFTYLINAYIVYCYFLLDWQHYYYYGELMYVGVAALMRCASISFKYATYDQYQYFRVKNQFLNLGSIGSEIILQQWFKQTSEVQFEEIYFQMRRHEVDDSLFFVAFMVNPTPNQLNLIQKNIIELADYSKKAQFQPEPVGHQVSKGENQFLFGYGILKLLLDHFHKRQSSVRKRLVILAFVIALSRNSIPFLTRFQESKHVLGSQISENIGIILTAFCTVHYY
ncbi:hypothetical protein PPERSA_01249 [Pseudocohnilembus persalinus]|uniref:Transmembrane protein n=1 Tax=Pseudocohnilembus persalinus TaxID=266149 RepID=A0A0V0QGK4_PSEPJ|nr:hypothetical protein PPERSA_01249 [Pseudocohnilembus persalinus]|eukprot:KRX01346.1 hypothetical protein PPERSA_01249 [Pseudocohnilembus persalinus]